MKKAIFTVPLYILFLSSQMFSAEKVTIAVLDLTAKDVPRVAANAVSDIIRSEFVNIGNFTVVERSQMNAILEEQGLQMSGCTDSACAVQFGKILSAKRIVIGEVSKIKKKVMITARYVDVGSGESLFSASAKADSIDEIDIAANTVAKKLAEKIVSGDKDVIIPKTMSGYYMRSSVPGWGQFYAGETAKGVIYSSLFVLSCAAAGYSYLNFTKAQSDYDGIKQGDTMASIKTKRDDYDKASMYVNISLGIVGAAYLIHWIDALFFTSGKLKKELALTQREDMPKFFCNVNSYIANSNYNDKKYDLSFGMRF